MHLKDILLTAESIGIDVTPENLDREVLEEFDQNPGASIADAAVELDGESKSMDEVDNAIDDGMAAVDAIDNLKEALPESGAPATDTELSIVQTTHESIMMSLGLQQVYTAESLQSKNLLATLEAQKEGIIGSIVAMLKKLGEMVVSFIAGLFRNVSLLERYMKSLEAKVKGVQGQEPKEKMMPPLNAISTARSSDVSSASTIGKTAIQMTKMADKAITEMQKFQTNFKRLISSGDESTAKAGEDTIVIEKDLYSTQSLGVNEKGNGFLSGRRAFGVDQIGGAGVTIKVMGAAPKATTVLTPGEMTFLLKDVREIISGMKTVEKKQSTIKSIINSLITGLSSIRAEFASHKNPSSERSARVWSNYLRKQVSFLLKSLMNESFRSAKALLDYIRASLKQYDVKSVADTAAASKVDPNAPRLGYKEKVHAAEWELV